MTGLLARQQRASTRADWRRLIITLALLAAASAAWRVARPVVIRALAGSSIGSHRAQLLRTALEERFPPLVFVEGHQLYPSSGSGPSFLTWDDYEWRQGRTSSWRVVDGRLDHVGNLRAACISFSLGDWDRDGLPEVMSTLLGVRELEIVVVRIRREVNEIAGVVSTGYAGRTASAVFYNYLSSFEVVDDRMSELVLRNRNVPRPSPVSATWPLVIAARFGWTTPGGILTPRILPDDGTIQLWALPDNRPFVFDPNEPLEDVVARLRPPDTQPASSPAAPPGPGL